MSEEEINKKFENADLTTVYMNGFYDGEKKWKDKIKELLLDKIRYRQFELQQEYKDFKDDIKLNTLQDIFYDLLEEDNK